MSDRVPESFADWVDGRLSPEERSSFEARMREDGEFRRAAEEYRETVQRIRSLRGSSDDRGPIDLVDAVMAQVESEAASARVQKWIPLFASVATAAAMLVLYLVLEGGSWGPSPEIRSVATGSEKELVGSDLSTDSVSVRARQAQGRLAEAKSGEMKLLAEQQRDSLKKLDGVVRVMDVTEVDPAGGLTAGKPGSKEQALAESEKSSTAPVASADRGPRGLPTPGPATPAPGGPALGGPAKRKVANSLPGQPSKAEAPESDDDSLASRWGESASTGSGSLVLVLTLPAVSTDKDRAESFFLGGGNRSPANEGAAEALRRGRSGDPAKVRQAAPQKNRPDETRRTRAAAKIEKKIVDEKATGRLSEESSQKKFKQQTELDAAEVAEKLKKSRTITGAAEIVSPPPILLDRADRKESAGKADNPRISRLRLNEDLLAALARIKSNEVAGEYRWASGDDVYVVSGERTVIRRYLNRLQQDMGRRGGKLKLQRSVQGSLITDATKTLAGGEELDEVADTGDSGRPVSLLIVVRRR